MSATQTNPDIRLLLLPLPEFAMLPFGGFIDKLRFTADEEDYSRQRYCSWSLLGNAQGHIKSSSGIAVQVQLTPGEINYADFDYLVVFGGRSAAATQALASTYGSILRAAASTGVKLVCVDNACFLFAACGLLNGHEVAIHWRHEAEFRMSFPRIRYRTDRIYHFDRSRISCPGGSAAIDLAVELLAQSCGRTKALKGLSDMLVDEARSSAHRVQSMEEDANSTPHLGRAITLMRTLLASGKNTEEIADSIGISRRQLDRLFTENHGVTASQYWTEMRLQHAKWRLLNSSHSVAAIADEIGATDASHLGKIFRKRFGVPPGRYRHKGS